MAPVVSHVGPIKPSMSVASDARTRAAEPSTDRRSQPESWCKDIKRRLVIRLLVSHPSRTSRGLDRRSW